MDLRPGAVCALANALQVARAALALNAEQAVVLDERVDALSDASDPGEVQRALRWVADLGRASFEKGIVIFAVEALRLLDS